MTPHGFSEDQLVEQPALDGPLYTRRPDAVGFVNGGLPLVVLELDKVKETVVLDRRQKAQARARV
jgi:hypothetical protein